MQSRGPILQHRMIEIKTWIRNLYCLVCDVITHPCHDFNGVFIINQSHINWVRKWMDNHTLLFNVHGIIHTCPKRDACLNRNPVYKTAPSPMSSLQKWFMCLWSIFCKYPFELMIIGCLMRHICTCHVNSAVMACSKLWLKKSLYFKYKSVI